MSDVERIKERIKELQEEINRTQKNKATNFHIGSLKRKISRLKEELRQKSSKGGGGSGYTVKKQGDATAVLVGFPSVGKSTLLNALTSAESKVGAYDFTTLDAIPGMMEYKDARIQLIDLPGIINEAAVGRGGGKQILSVVRNSDLILIVLDYKGLDKLSIIENELFDFNLRLDTKPPRVSIKKKDRGGINIESVRLTKITREEIIKLLNEHKIHNADIIIYEDLSLEELNDVLENNRHYVPSMIVITKSDQASEEEKNKVKEFIRRISEQGRSAVFVSAETKTNIDDLKQLIFDKLGFIRVYTKPVGKKMKKTEPIILKKGSTVRDVCTRIHKDFVKKFREARIWGSSVRFAGQRVGLDHELNDEDVIRIII